MQSGCVRRPSVEPIQDVINLAGRQIFVILVIDHHHRRTTASSETLFFALEVDAPVLGTLAELDAKLAFDVVDDVVDAVIDKVLESAGSVVFTPPGALRDQEQIVLLLPGAEDL